MNAGMTQQTQTRKPRAVRAPKEGAGEKRPRGRPELPPEQRLKQKSVRFPQFIWDKIDQYGIEWARKVLARAKPPQE